MEISEAIKHCYDRREYPEVFSDTDGFDISIPGFITKCPELPRTIKLEVTTFCGISWDAIHYYGNIYVEGIIFSKENDPNTITICKKTFDKEKENPLAGDSYHIELVRPVTIEEIESNQARWDGYEIGMNTNAFNSPEEVIALAKEICKARLKGNWILKIIDYSGKNLDSEILINEL